MVLVLEVMVVVVVVGAGVGGSVDGGGGVGGGAMLGLVCLSLTSRMHIFQPGKLCDVWRCLDRQAQSWTKTRRLLQHFCNSSTNYRAPH